jgi:prepilin-type N-terminal cleavage/methylation domain-containing protein
VRGVRAAGFSLPELLLALALGLTLSAMALQAMVGDGSQAMRLSRLLRERTVQRRTLALLRDDVRRAAVISLEPAAEQSPCGWSGRRPVLHVRRPDGAAITYAVGAAPDPIWRGPVLVRCGPAYGLDGEPSDGGWQNRVVIDNLASAAAAWADCGDLLAHGAAPLEGTATAGLTACVDSTGEQLALRLQQAFVLPGGRRQTVTSTATALAGATALPGAVGAVLNQTSAAADP